MVRMIKNYNVLIVLRTRILSRYIQLFLPNKTGSLPTETHNRISINRDGYTYRITSQQSL